MPTSGLNYAFEFWKKAKKKKNYSFNFDQMKRIIFVKKRKFNNFYFINKDFQEFHDVFLSEFLMFHLYENNRYKNSLFSDAGILTKIIKMLNKSYNAQDWLSFNFFKII